MEIEKSKVKVCSACEGDFAGAGDYCCTEPHCTFNLHKSCFESPQEIDHKSHLHPLTLLTAPSYSDGSFACDACRKTGKAFAYTCSTCSYDLHIDCIRWPDTVSRPDHAHDLNLCYKSPVAGVGVFVCDVCREAVDENGWLYYCKECDFGTHLDCVKEEVKEVEVGGGAPAAGDGISRYEEELCRFQLQKMKMGYQLQIA